MGKSTRPKVERRDTRKTKASAEADLNRGIEITIAGRAYAVRIGDVSPDLARELRRETGFGFLQLFGSLVGTPDVDTVSAWIWLARRVEGEDVTLAEVDSEVTYATIGQLEEAKTLEGPGDTSGPEA